MEFQVSLTKEEVAVVIGSILVAERTMPDAVVNVALSVTEKLGAALDAAGV